MTAVCSARFALSNGTLNLHLLPGQESLRSRNSMSYVKLRETNCVHEGDEATSLSFSRVRLNGPRSEKKPPQKYDDASKTLRALKTKNRAPKRWLGQHYMVNDEVTRRTVEVADIRPGELVLEIGPGTGALTQALLDAGADVIAVEKDPDMVSLVAERFASCPRVQVVEGDFLKWPIAAQISAALAAHEAAAQAAGLKVPSRAKVVANLPFNITSEVLQRVLPLGDLLSSAILMLQEEAAQRLISALPSSGSEYRRMSLLVQFYSDPKYRFFVDRASFLPPPNVDAAVATFRIKRRSDWPSVSSESAFFSMLSAAFNGKRKMLRNTLQHLASSALVAQALQEAGLPPTSRPEELNLDQFTIFFGFLEAKKNLQLAPGATDKILAHDAELDVPRHEPIRL